MGEVVLFGSPVGVGHVRPLVPLAQRLLARGIDVVWAISGDPDEPAAKWHDELSALGVTFVDLDAIAPFEARDTGGATSVASMVRRVTGRANTVADSAVAVLRRIVAGRTIVGGVYDFFALWFYVAAKALGVSRVQVVVSAFPGLLTALPSAAYANDPVVQEEMAALRARGLEGFDGPMGAGVVPQLPSLDVICFSSPRLCTTAPPYAQLLGLHRAALPSIDELGELSPEDRSVVSRLAQAREAGSRVVLLSMGTMVMRRARGLGDAHVAFLHEVYSSLAASALAQGAIVVASTSVCTTEELGIDVATLGEDAASRLIAMPFVPQPLLFAHGLIDLMVMHGGANTFYEAMLSGVPVVLCPAFADQGMVSAAATELGLGVSVQTVDYPSLEGGLPLAHVAEVALPAMLEDGNRWTARAQEMADLLRSEDGLAAAEALVLAQR